MQQKSCHRLIYKIHSKRLKRSNWDLTLDLERALIESPEDIVALSDSQALRFIDDINGVSNITADVNEINRRIRLEKKKPRSRETKHTITQLYNKLYSLQFQKDYVCIIMDSNADYDRANQGFRINGISFKRFLGTNGGIKNSTIVYVNSEIHDELMRRLDNGRSKDIPLVPAKLEAYQALICSGSVPIPQPNGIIVVDDCYTTFKEDVILLSDDGDGEPTYSFVKDREINHNDSDGYGLMLPSYSRKVNEYLNGNGEAEISGMNTRFAWTKGMVYTFDFIEFADKVAKTYEVVDIWGDKRDIRNAEVILTGSMLKLWNCYPNWETYYENCQNNKYQFSTTKTTPDELENVRDTNYQFLQSYEFDDEEIHALCQPTIDEINSVLGMDYRKTLVYLCGSGLNENKVLKIDNDYIKALMIEPKMINDPYVRRNIYTMIKKRIECAKKGSIQIYGNYAMISGDPYALCQSIFGLEVTGILSAGEVYHKYWIDKDANEIVCFRAPMTCHNNIRRMRLNKSVEASYWYRYIKTALIFNAFDTACDAMNGADKDGDTNMCTDNHILIKRTLNSPTIMCIQRNAEKKIVTEEDIIKANKLAFNDDIGVVTNYVTSMIERQAGFEKGTDEYNVLAYRIMCGQLYQQNTIDRAKGIIAKSMPEYWHSYRDTIIKDGDDPDEVKNKLFNQRIVASHKPYFMIYVYPQFKKRIDTYIKNSSSNIRKRYVDLNIHNIDELRSYPHKTDDMNTFLEYYDSQIPYGGNPCVVNRICWIYENAFPSYSAIKEITGSFDYSILKSGFQYSKQSFDEIAVLYLKYKQETDNYFQKSRMQNVDSNDSIFQHEEFLNRFRMFASKICPNKYELCDVLIDLCYKTEGSKQFVWDIAGSTIIENLLKRNGYLISFPEHTGKEFEFCGEGYTMKTICVEGLDDYFE